MRTTTRAALALAATATLTISSAAAAAPGRNNMQADAERSTAGASVFKVNPVQSSGDQTLTDQKDSATAVPVDEYAPVDLTRLDGSGYLRGDWVTVESSTGKAAYSATGSYLYNRAEDQFEQVMAYFWITRAQDYLQGLGFGSTLPGVMDEQIAVKINQLGGDNSYQTDKPFRLRFGKGGVDDAEDAEVIVHEYGHAIQADQVPGYGTSFDARVIGEGFSDYLAVSVGLAVSADEGWDTRPDNDPYETSRGWEAEACFADWDATEVSPLPVKCLRRLDQTFTTADRTGDLYRESMIWSGALWQIRKAYEDLGVGSAAWDTTLIVSQFGYAPGTSFAAAAQQAVDTAAQRDGTAAADAVRAEFVERGILS
ncbi:hypothetical protein GCM10009623_00640 [Nocardioides aestuarii]|uniref:Bacillolysin n=1 Tax=Nocardioides aestuarii TaxID=252231 RepID=A0ABW4TH62_9ACTN